ncbi:MAG: hypothetical protein ABI693_22730 [Bryobacteraceae bacterium]
MTPTNEYVEIRNGGYYVAGTRIGLDVELGCFRSSTNQLIPIHNALAISSTNDIDGSDFKPA